MTTPLAKFCPVMFISVACELLQDEGDVFPPQRLQTTACNDSDKSSRYQTKNQVLTRGIVCAAYQYIYIIIDNYSG